jgi:oligopeptidase B
MQDEFAWLRDKNWPKVTDPKVLAYLNVENDYFKEKTHQYQELEKEIYLELKARIKEDDESYPIKKGDYYYFVRLEKDKYYPIYFRKNKTEIEELLLDANILGFGKSSFAMGYNVVSDDHSKLIYSFDDDGSERYTICIKDLQLGQDLPDIIKDTIGTIVWNKTNDGFYYTSLSEQWRSDRVFFHKLDTTQAEDILIYQELDPRFNVDISRSSSEEYLLIESGNSTSNETHYFPLKNPQLRLSIKRRADHLYSLDHMGNEFYITTNDKGKNFRLVSLNERDSFKPNNFKEIIEHSSESYLIDTALYEQYLVVSKRILGLNRIEYYDLKTQKFIKNIDFNEEVYEANISFTTKDDKFLRISYSSLTKPRSALEYDFDSQVLYTRKTDEIPSGYNFQSYESKRLWVKSIDGTQIPISMVYRKDNIDKTPNKLLLYGYGSYGYAMPMSFRANIISLLDRGFIYVIAHIRGGDELGFNWYESAKFLTKKRSFEDFIAVAEYLIENKYTTSDKLSIMGGSAGGMLMGVVLNSRPDLFKSAVALVPFVDVLNTMLDETLPLTPPEFEEWGNPANPEYYDYIKSYSPYDNVKKQVYPNMLVTAGLTDPRVGYWEAAKWVAKLREYKLDDNLLLLKTEMDAGHKGQSGRFKGLEEIAMIYSFIINNT